MSGKKKTIRVYSHDGGADIFHDVTDYQVDADGVLTITDEDGPVATFAAGSYVSVRREREL